MNKARLLVISPPCHQPINRSVYREVADREIDVHLVVPRKHFVGGAWHETPPSEASPGYRMTLLDMKGRHPRLYTLEGLSTVIDEWGPSHIFVDGDPASLLVRQAIRAGAGTPVWAMTAENLPIRHAAEIWEGVRTLKPRKVAGALMVWGLRRTVQPKVARVFTLSREGTAVMAGMGNQTTQILLGFDPRVFDRQPAEYVAATRARLGLKQPTVAYFGRLTPEKGVHLLIKALASIKELNWQLLIDNFGTYETPYRRTLKRLIEEQGLLDRVVYFDAYHEEMPDFMNAADVVVLPSVSTPKWKEQYGRVIQEAMACGKTFVGSDSGAIPEVMGGHGFVFPEGDTEALAALLEQVLREQRFVDMEARSYARANLSISRQAEILVQEIERSK